MELGKYIFSDLEKNSYLISLYTDLIKGYANKIFNGTTTEIITKEKTKDLLRFADLLSKSTDDLKKQNHNNIAQNIIVLLNNLMPNNEEVKKVYISVLNHIRNYRGVTEEYYNTDIREFIADYIEKELYRFETNEEKGYFVRDQKNIFNNIKTEKFYSYSGPTSMGKTFIIRKFIINQVAEDKKKNYVIVVPTKALISEITSDFISELGELLKEKNYKVVNTHNEIIPEHQVNYIMVYTQERFLSHLINSDITVDYVFIDEAHKLFNEDTRSMLLFRILDILKNQDSTPNIYFSAPLIRNPNEFLNLLPEVGKRSSSVFEFIPVNQQKFILDLDEGIVKIYNQLTNGFVEEKYEEIKDIELISLINKIGENSKNLIYCETKKDALELAEKYASNKKEIINDEELEKVKKYIREEIHEEYLLIDLLSKGVAYHVGYIPNTIRKHIENLFKTKTIDSIFCTSTLLEGVNLPADNLFITVKDKSKIIRNDIDFKNLMGRVGRIKYNLTGNVYIIPNGLPKLFDRCSDLIIANPENKELSINKILTKYQKKEIVDKLRQGNTFIEKKNRTYDTYESTRYIMNSLINDIVEDKRGIIYKQFKDILTEEDLKIIKKNFKEKIVPQDLPITTDQIENVDASIKNRNLFYPEKITYENVLYLLKNMYEMYNWNNYEDKNTIGNKSKLKYYAVVLQKWMLGFNIKQIIKDAIEHHEKTRIIYDARVRREIEYDGSVKQKNIIINETLNAIEDIILYKFSNYFSKFSKRCMEIKDVTELENDWYEYIQYGSNNAIVLKIQKYGFSREAALKIYSKNYFIFVEDSIYIQEEIMEDADELLRNEALQVKLNNYHIFKS